MIHPQLRFVVAACLLALSPSVLLGQPRPRIGLALGGGAARGFAHIGVLKWFDEHRIPVDAIAGTSMGGLIGGAFASGMTPAEVEALVASMHWDVMLSPDAPFADKSFRRKEDARAFPTDLAVGLRGGLSLPAGLSMGQPADIVLGRTAMPYYALATFDDLPTPFRCVAADLRKSEIVVFDRGWLAQAMRATMAIPGVFTPVTIGDQVLVDGGVLNNLPADVVAAMGADIVIAVDVSNELVRHKPGQSLLGVLFDALDVMMRDNTRRSLRLATLVLKPELKGFWGTDFDKAPQLIARGYAAAEARRAELERFALAPADYEAYRAARMSRRRTLLPPPVSVEIEGVDAAEATRLRSRFAPFVGRPLDEAAVERELALLMGTERYMSATYRLVGDGLRPGMVVTVKPKTWGPPFVLVAADLRNNPSTGIGATGRARVVLADITGPGDEGRIDVALGTLTGIGAEWYRPLGRTGLFFAPRGHIEQSRFNVFDGSAFRAEYNRVSSRAGADVGFTSGNRLELRAGYHVEHLDGRTKVGEALVPRIDGTQAFFEARATYDGQTGAVVPERGLYVKASLRKFTRAAKTVPAVEGATSDPPSLLSGEADALLFAPVGRRGRLFFRASGGTSFGSTAVINAFALGGPFALGALNEGELRGSHFVLGSAGYLHQVYRFAQGAAGAIYVGGWIETGSAFDRWRGTHMRTNLSVGLIVDTPLGPVSAAYSLGFDGRNRFYASLGPTLRR